MILFKICIPFSIEHFRSRETVKKMLFHWFTIVGWALGLTKFYCQTLRITMDIYSQMNQENVYSSDND
jgi:hypothetical protein